MRRRRAFTLVELAVAAALLSGLVALVYAVADSSGRQGAQVEQRSALLEAAWLLQESLAWDLRRSLDLGVLPAEARRRGVPLEELTLPLFAGYDAGASPSRAMRPRTYRFDDGVVYRDGVPLVSGGLSRVEFAWTPEAPAELQVVLRGEGGDGFAFRLPAPAGTDPAGMWRPAARHRGAREP